MKTEKIKIGIIGVGHLGQHHVKHYHLLSDANLVGVYDTDSKRGKEIANILIHDIAPSYMDRQGGYTRLIKLNNRNNDNAPVSLIEFVDIAPGITEAEVDDKTDKEKGDVVTK